MKKIANDGSNRRKFLSLGLLGGAALITQKATAMIPVEPEAEETVPMLTADGKLVQVSKKVLEQTENRQKARNKDVLEWSKVQNQTTK